MAVARLFKQYGEDNGFFKKLKFTVSGEDFREGLTAIVSVKVPEPQFKGQTKGELGNSEVTSVVSQIVGETLRHFLEENPNEAKRILEKVVLAATAREAARKAREMVQRKNVLTGGGLSPASWRTAATDTLRKVKSSLSRGTPRVVRRSRVETVIFRPSCP